jgi:hypothetical protein
MKCPERLYPHFIVKEEAAMFFSDCKLTGKTYLNTYTSVERKTIT